jgi:hypothetical protein
MTIFRKKVFGRMNFRSNDNFSEKVFGHMNFRLNDHSVKLECPEVMITGNDYR